GWACDQLAAPSTIAPANNIVPSLHRIGSTSGVRLKRWVVLSRLNRQTSKGKHNGVFSPAAGRTLSGPVSPPVSCPAIRSGAEPAGTGGVLMGVRVVVLLVFGRGPLGRGGEQVR